MKSFTPTATSFSNSKTFLASLLACIMLVAPLTPIGFASTNRLAPVQSKGAAKQTPPPQKADPVSSAAPRKQKERTAAVSAVGITATKTDNRTAAQPVGPTDTINYTVTITNNGTSDATGVAFTDTIDSNTTLVPGSIQSTPLANPDTYNVIGNVRIQPNAAQGLLANDFNPDNGNNTGLTVSGPTTSTQNGNVVVNADGSFSYNPAPGFTGTDTFTYTVTNSTTSKTDTSTVTLLVGNGTATPGSSVIWFINNTNTATPRDGRITNPFNSIAEFNSTAADEVGDIIFIYTGSGAYTGPVVLLNNQQLIGQGVALTTASGFTVPAYSDPLPGAAAAPTINSAPAAGSSIVTLNGAAGGNTIRGVTLGNATDSDIAGNNFGTLTVSDTTINGTGRALSLSNGTLAATFLSISSSSSPSQGITLSTIGGSLSTPGTTIFGNPTQCVLVSGSTLAADFGNTSCTGGTDGISLQNNSGTNVRTFGTLSVSGGSGNAFLHATGGGNTSVTGAATLSSNNNPIEIQNAGNGQVINFSGGATVSKSTAGGAGVNWGGTNTGATLNFASLGITTSNGSGLVAVGGGTLNVTTGTIGATGSAGQAAPAINANAVTLNATFSSVSSTNSGNSGNGILLTNVPGTLVMNGGSISGAAGDAFRVNGGTAGITYGGTISTALARPVNIDNKTGGTVAFGGAISSTSNGVLLNNNAGATINFTGGLNLSTGANPAFTATGGGTVNATQNNTSLLNTITTTTGTAVNIATPTNIGGSGVTFRSVTVNNNASNSATNAIILNGTTGAFTVSGDGSQTGGFFDRDGSGGTLNRTTGHSVLLTNASNVTLRQMNITNTAAGGSCPGACTSNGVNSSGGSNVVLSAILLQNLGGNGWLATNLGGTSAFNNNGRVENWNTINSNGINVANTNTNFTSFTVDRSVFTTSATGAAGFLFSAEGTTSGGTVNVTGSEFTLLDQLGVQINNNGSGTNTAIIQRNNFHDADATGGDGNNTLYVTNNGSGQLNFTIGGANAADGNTFKNLARLLTLAGVVQVDAATSSKTGTRLNGSIQNNNISNDAGFVNGRRAIDVQIEANASTHNGHSILISDNVVNNVAKQGVHVSLVTVAGGDIPNNNITIRNNSLGVTSPVGTEGNVDSGSAIEVENNHDQANLGATHSTNLLVQGNTAVNNNNSGVGSTLEINSRAVGGNNTSLMNVTVWGNTFNNLNAGGEVIEILTSTGDGTATSSICLDINAANNPANRNTATGGTVASQIKLSSNAPSGTFSIEGMSAGAQSAANVQTFVAARNNGTVAATGNFVGSTGCTESSAIASPVLEKSASVATVASGDTSAAAPAQISAPLAGDLTSRAFIAMPQAAKAVQTQTATPGANAVQTAGSAGDEQDKAETARATREKNGATPLAIANFPVTIGTLGAGKSVTLTFSVTVNNPLAGSVTQISNQGTVSGSNFSSVLTDDPDVAGANNPTVTPVIPQPTVTINNATAPEPQSGSAPMSFTITLSGVYSVPVSVDYQTADGTATQPTDYTATSGTLTFNAGETFKTVSVPVNADGDAGESDETFTLTLSAPVNTSINGTGIGTGTITAANPPGRVLISELRMSGPGGADDEFVELYNNQDVAQDISGWAIVKSGATCDATPVVVAVIPPSTTIPARGHYLVVGQSYSLGTSATADLTIAPDLSIEDDRNVGLFNTSSLASLSTTTREDAVGFFDGVNGLGGNCDLLREGTPLNAAQGSTSQYSFFRKLFSGKPQDTGRSVDDFQLVSTTPGVPVGFNNTPTLGAPGPENLAAPIQRNAAVKSSLIDPMLPTTAPPNRVRSSFGANSTNAAFGTLSIQRRFKNTLGVSVTRLRFRVVDLTTINNRAAGQADLRVLSSTGVVTDSAGNPVVTVNGLTLEQPAQPNGGGLNSSLTVVLPGGGLAPGNSIDVQFLLGVQEQGSFSFFVNVEALPGPGTVANEATGATKAGVTRKQGDANAGGAAQTPEKQ
ncbi:MAG TPA: Calx-beta domain-containing protein [Pyrinomonadaceae bacterium]|nr:Calx-beta domain-containing protein [Pyrinomonadaceae bacterium]